MILFDYLRQQNCDQRIPNRDNMTSKPKRESPYVKSQTAIMYDSGRLLQRRRQSASVLCTGSYDATSWFCPIDLWSGIPITDQQFCFFKIAENVNKLKVALKFYIIQALILVFCFGHKQYALIFASLSQLTRRLKISKSTIETEKLM